MGTGIYGVYCGCLVPYIPPFTEIPQELQLTFEQHEFELHGSTYMWILFH